MLDISAVLPTFVVTLREGVEAALVVGIVLTYLYKAQRFELRGWVYGGVVAGVAASILLGIAVVGLLTAVNDGSQTYNLLLKPLLEAGFTLTAIVLLSWMLLWMTRQGQKLKAEVEQELRQVLLSDHDQLPRAIGWGIFSLIFVAVLREGFETVLFLTAQFRQGWLPLLGATSGLVGAGLIGVLLFGLGVRVNLRRFFQVMGGFLLLIVAGLTIGLLKKVDAAIGGYLQLHPEIVNFCFSPTPACVLGPIVWDNRTTLPDGQFPGVVLKALFGYRQQLYLAQGLVYLTFLGFVGGWFCRLSFGGPTGSQKM